MNCLAAFLLLGSSRFLLFTAGILLMGVAHAVITIKGVHLASHGALSESQAWGKFWAVFFIEVRNKLKAAIKHQFLSHVALEQCAYKCCCCSALKQGTQSNSFEFWGKKMFIENL